MGNETGMRLSNYFNYNSNLEDKSSERAQRTRSIGVPLSPSELQAEDFNHEKAIQRLRQGISKNISLEGGVIDGKKNWLIKN